MVETHTRGAAPQGGNSHVFLLRLDEAFSWPPLFSFSANLAVCFFFISFFLLRGKEERGERIIVLFRAASVVVGASDNRHERRGNKGYTK